MQVLASIQIVILLEEILLEWQTGSALLEAIVGERRRLIVIGVEVVGGLWGQRRL